MTRRTRQGLCIILALMLNSYELQAALSASIVWDVRTTGSDSNGGGFKTGATGTDYSQQNTAQVAYTDLIIGGTTTQYTSVAHSPTSDLVGNVVKIVSGTGCTVGWYEVTSVAAGVATVDRSLGTAASTCTANLGGSLATPFSALTTNPVVGGQIIYIKSGTYTATTGSSQNTNTVYVNFNNSDGNAPIYLEGYGTTHGDLGTAPLFTTATNSVWLFGVNGNGGYRFTNLSMSSTASTRVAAIFVPNSATGAGVSTVEVIGCTLDGFKWAINGDNGSSRQNMGSLQVVGTEIKNSQTNGIIIQTANNLNVFGSWIHDNASGAAIDTTNASTILIERTILSGNVIAVKTGAAGNFQFANSTCASNTSDCLQWSAGAGETWITNSIFYNNTGWGVNITTSTTANGVVVSRNNAFGANGSGTVQNGGRYTGTGDVTLSASPFVSSSNFALNNTAGGGASLRKTGFPGTFPAGSTVGYLDIGAVQTSGGAGSGQASYPSVK